MKKKYLIVPLLLVLVLFSCAVGLCQYAYRPSQDSYYNDTVDRVLRREHERQLRRQYEYNQSNLYNPYNPYNNNLYNGLRQRKHQNLINPYNNLITPYSNPYNNLIPPYSNSLNGYNGNLSVPHCDSYYHYEH